MTDQIRKCGHPLGSTRWCPDCELAEAMATGEFATPLPAQVQPAEQVGLTDERIMAVYDPRDGIMQGHEEMALRFARRVLCLASSAQQQPVSAEVLDALNAVDDFIARCNGDDRGSCESVEILRRALSQGRPA